MPFWHQKNNIKQKTPSRHQKNLKTKNTKKTNKTNKNEIRNQSISKTLDVFTANANGMKKKVFSLKYLIKHLDIGVFTLQEPKFVKKGNLIIVDFEIFEASRKKEGGGTMIGAHKSLEPILIQVYSEEFELLIVETKVGGKHICVISGYGPQECWSPDRRMPVFTALEEEVTKAELS